MGSWIMAKKKNSITSIIILILVLICTTFILLDVSTNIQQEVGKEQNYVEINPEVSPDPGFETGITPEYNSGGGY